MTSPGQDASPGSAERYWVVLHTRPRCEKKAAALCDRKGIVRDLPLIERSRRYGKRLRTFHNPLFPGYLFAHVDDGERTFLRQNQYIANVLGIVNQETFAFQVRQIRKALESRQVLEVLPYLEVGKPVKILYGPFKGLDGVITRIKGKNRFVLNVEAIQQSLVIEVPAENLGPAS